RVDHARDTVGGPERRRAELRRDCLDRRARGPRVEPDAAAEEVRRIEKAEYQVRVGHRREGAAFAVARGPRQGAGALGPSVGDAPGVARRDRAAVGVERMDVDRRQRDLRNADRLLASQLRLTALQECDVGGRAAYVERDEVRLAEEPSAVAAGGDAAGR